MSYLITMSAQEKNIWTKSKQKELQESQDNGMWLFATALNNNLHITALNRVPKRAGFNHWYDHLYDLLNSFMRDCMTVCFILV